MRDSGSAAVRSPHARSEAKQAESATGRPTPASRRYARPRHPQPEAVPLGRESDALFLHAPAPILIEDASAIRRRMLEARRDGVRDFQAHLVEHPELLLRCAADLRVLDANSASLRLFGARTLEELRTGLERAIGDPAVTGFLPSVVAIAEGRPSVRTEAVVRTAKDEERHVEISWVVAPGSEETYDRIFVLLSDVTARVDAERALAASERRFRVIFDNMAAGMLVTDEGGRIAMANRQACELLALPPEPVGLRLAERFPEAEALLSAPRRAGRQQLDVETGAGKKLTIGFNTVPLELPQGPGRLTIFREIGGLMRAEARRQRTEQLAHVGELAAKLGHEIKNPLASILAGLQLLARDVGLGHGSRELIGSVLDEVRRLGQVIDEFLAGARPAPLAPRPVSANRVLAETLGQLEAFAANRVVRLKVRPDVGDEDPVVHLDVAAFRRALHNLVINAVDAAGRGGNVTIDWTLLPKEEVRRRFPGVASQVLRIRVVDDGPGIAAENLRRIFRPFFTTKPSGTGLGLPMAREIVESHGGMLCVRSRPGEGTEFEIYLTAGERPNCWNATPGCSADCEGCAVRRRDVGYFCWAYVGSAHRAETGRWLPSCAECQVFIRYNLCRFCDTCPE